MRRFALAVTPALALLLGWAPPVGAHAELRSTDPAGGAVLGTAPRRITLEFTARVEIAQATIRLVDGEGREVTLGTPYHPDGASRVVASDVVGLAPGSYAVAWRVISADGHPLQGTFAFQAGAAPASVSPENRVVARRLLVGDDDAAGVGGVYGVVRFGGFIGLLVLVGAGAFVVGVWRHGLEARRVRRLLVVAWIVTAFCTAAAIGLQGAYAGGRPLADAIDPSQLRATADTRVGVALLFRLALLAAVAPVLWLLLAPARDRLRWPVIGAAAILGFSLLLTPGIAGHAAAADNAALMVVSDVIHLAAAAFWVGGIAVLVVALLPGGDIDQVDAVVGRFANLAFAAVAVIVATGLFQSWQQLAEVGAATRTTYGRLLLVKVGIFVAMVAAAGVSRRWLRRRRVHTTGAAAVGASAQVPVAVTSLRRSVAVEAVAGAAVLAVTALLVNAVPGRTALAEPYATTLEMDGLVVDLTVDPAKAGPTDVHLYTLEPTGAVADVSAVDAALTLPGRAAAPLAVPLRRAGPGHYSATGFELPVPGRGRLDVAVRHAHGDGSEARARAVVPVR